MGGERSRAENSGGRSRALLALEDRTLLSTFTVTNTADSGKGSLPYEIGLANSTTGSNTIDFGGSVFSTSTTIILNGTQLELSNTSGTQTITGPSARVTVSGGRLSRVFQVDAGVTAVITGLTIYGGKASGSGGGGLYNNGGTTTLSDLHRQRKLGRHKRRRRFEPRGHDDAEQHHLERKLGDLKRRRRVHCERHDHADELHGERQLRLRQRRWPVRL